MVLLLQLFVTPSKETPAQINHTLVLLLALILLVLAPILTSIRASLRRPLPSRPHCHCRSDADGVFRLRSPSMQPSTRTTAG